MVKCERLVSVVMPVFGGLKLVRMLGGSGESRLADASFVVQYWKDL